MNSANSVLQVYLGMVFHANKRYFEALEMLGKASKLQPSNPQVKDGQSRGKEKAPRATRPVCTRKKAMIV